MKIALAITLIATSIGFGQPIQIQQIPYEEFRRMTPEQQRNIAILQNSMDNQRQTEIQIQIQARQLQELQRQTEILREREYQPKREPYYFDMNPRDFDN